MAERICPICGRPVVSRQPSAKYCSRNCYKEAAKKRAIGEIRPEYVAAAKRALAALDDEHREAIRMMVEGAW